VKLKTGAVQDGVRHYTWYVIGAVDALSKALGHGEVTVTSLCDGHANRPKSLHNKGLAADFRTRHLSPAAKIELYKACRGWLDPMGFDTVLESDHLHIEYDSKPGEIFAEWVE